MGGGTPPAPPIHPSQSPLLDGAQKQSLEEASPRHTHTRPCDQNNGTPELEGTFEVIWFNTTLFKQDILDCSGQVADRSLPKILQSWERSYFHNQLWVWGWGAWLAGLLEGRYVWGGPVPKPGLVEG